MASRAEASTESDVKRGFSTFREGTRRAVVLTVAHDVGGDEREVGQRTRGVRELQTRAIPARRDQSEGLDDARTVPTIPLLGDSGAGRRWYHARSTGYWNDPDFQDLSRILGL